MNEANKAFYESMLEMSEMLHSVGRIDEEKYAQVKNTCMTALTPQTSTPVYLEPVSPDSGTNNKPENLTSSTE